MLSSGYQVSIFEVRAIVTSGPAAGYTSTYIGPYVINATMEEWGQYIKPGDRLLLVGGDGETSTLGYLYGDTEICVDSTISTPTFRDNLKRYWEKNPQKYPNVVVLRCWDGEACVDEDSWIMWWLENEFQADKVIDGKYWRYYLKEDGGEREHGTEKGVANRGSYSGGLVWDRLPVAFLPAVHGGSYFDASGPL